MNCARSPTTLDDGVTCETSTKHAGLKYAVRGRAALEVSWIGFRTSAHARAREARWKYVCDDK
eukprot:428777-Pleurochrysis_carterae.AAC.2